MKKLIDKECVPCEGGVDLLTKGEIDKYKTEINSQWEVADNLKSIEKEFSFPNFRKALHFVNVVGDIAEIEDHHPDITIFYNKVFLSLSTHAIDGLSENDFILAAKIDKTPFQKLM